MQRYAAAGKLDGRAAILVVVARPGACGLALRLRFRTSGRRPFPHSARSDARHTRAIRH